jgi:hypothetical protein
MKEGQTEPISRHLNEKIWRAINVYRDENVSTPGLVKEYKGSPFLFHLPKKKRKKKDVSLSIYTLELATPKQQHDLFKGSFQLY